MVTPSLSKLERERIATAAKLAASGVTVRGRIGIDRLWYVAHGKEHEVLSLSTNRAKFLDLVRQAEAAFKAELERAHGEAKRLAEAKRATTKETPGRSEAGTVEVETVPAVDRQLPVHSDATA